MKGWCIPLPPLNIGLGMISLVKVTQNHCKETNCAERLVSWECARQLQVIVTHPDFESGKQRTEGLR